MIDTHVHLDTSRFKKDVKEVLKASRNVGVNRFVIPAIDSTDMDRLVKLSEDAVDIFFAAGHHPNTRESVDMHVIEKLASHEKCVAIGECGLDWYRIPPGANISKVKAYQKDLFEKQLDLAEKMNLPVILHSRETDFDMLDVLSNFNVTGVVHCYVGSDKLLSLADKGFFFGIGGVITYDNADLKRNVKKIPADRIVLETDAPYLAPKSAKDRKRNSPINIPLILEEIEKITGKKDFAEQTVKNTYKLFPKLF